MKILEERKTWAEAETTCIDNGGHLATIGTQAQNDWIAEQTMPMLGKLGWHGATDQFSEGTWTDPLGQNELTFTNWFPGNPNGGNCGAIYGGLYASCPHC